MLLMIVVLRAEVFLEATGCIGFFYQTLLAADWASAFQHSRLHHGDARQCNEEAETRVYLPTELTWSLIPGTSNTLYFGQ